MPWLQSTSPTRARAILTVVCAEVYENAFDDPHPNCAATRNIYLIVPAGGPAIRPDKATDPWQHETRHHHGNVPLHTCIIRM